MNRINEEFKARLNKIVAERQAFKAAGVTAIVPAVPKPNHEVLLATTRRYVEGLLGRKLTDRELRYYDYHWFQKIHKNSTYGSLTKQAQVQYG